MIAVFMHFGLLWLHYRQKQPFRRREMLVQRVQQMHQRNTCSTSHYSINLRIVLKVVSLRHSSTLCPRFLYIFSLALLFYNGVRCDDSATLKRA